jgi:hypothetical protein
MSTLTAPADYARFLEGKTHADGGCGFEPLWVPDFLFDFQKALVEWAVRLGRAAIFADCGLGKTAQQLVWAQNVARHTNRAVLVLTPLAVASQTIREAEKFGIDAVRCGDGKAAPAKINVTNYERLHHFDPGDFAGVVCDESSILKNFDGTRRKQITDFMRSMRYRLLCTATAAPNDFYELGTSSEALGYLGARDMLTRFFKSRTRSRITWAGAARRTASGATPKNRSGVGCAPGLGPAASPSTLGLTTKALNCRRWSSASTSSRTARRERGCCSPSRP